MIDIISTIGNQCPDFTVDTTKTDVAIGGAVPGGVLTPDPANGYPFFAPGDSFTIVSYGVTLPYAFSQGALNALVNPFTPSLPSIIIAIKESGGLPLVIDAMPVWTVPYLNAEIISGLYVDLTLFNAPGNLYTGHKFQLYVTWTIQAYASMIGCPAALNGTTQHAPFWFKVDHTLPMVV